MNENKQTIPDRCPNNKNCSHRKKTFEQLQKDFPNFQSKTLESLQINVCQLCLDEMDGCWWARCLHR